MTGSSKEESRTGKSFGALAAACNAGSDGIEGYSQRYDQGKCILITGNISNLTALGFDHVLSSIRFKGSFGGHTKELALFRKPGYLDNCDTVLEDQPDLGSCVNQVMSTLVVSATPPPTIP